MDDIQYHSAVVENFENKTLPLLHSRVRWNIKTDADTVKMIEDYREYFLEAAMKMGQYIEMYGEDLDSEFPRVRQAAREVADRCVNMARVLNRLVRETEKNAWKLDMAAWYAGGEKGCPPVLD